MTSRLGATLLLALAVTLAGCGGAGRPESTAMPGPSVETECGDLPAGLKPRGLWLRTSDGVRLYAAKAGEGSKTVVLLHQLPANLCGWLQTMQLLAGHGIRALAVDLRGFGRSTVDRTAGYSMRPDIEAAVAEARAEGADEVFLMGASFGGATAMTYAPHVKDVDGLINLSGELQLERLDAIGAVPRLRVPFLVVAGRRDPLLDAADARKLVAAAGSTDKQLAVFPGTYHGWDLLDTAPYRTKAQALVLDWLDEH